MRHCYESLLKVLCKVESGLLVLLFAVMSLTVFVQIVLRSVFSITILELEDVAKYSFVWLIFIGIARVFRDDGHIAITFFISRMRPRTAAALDYAQRCLVTVFLLVLFVEGIRFCIGGMDEIVSQLRMPAGYIYLVVPLCAFLSLVVYLGYLLRWLPDSEDKAL